MYKVMPIFKSHPHLESEWSDKNTVDPDSIFRGTSFKTIWVCSLGHEYESTPASRIRGRGCPYCSGNKILVGYNDLGSTKPHLAKELDETRSGITASELTSGSNKICWWRCPKGHSYSSSVKSRTSGRGCAVCHGLQINIGINDLATTHPDLASELDEDLSGFGAKSVTFGSQNKAVWRCSKNSTHIWEAKISSRAWGRGCPKCSMVGVSKRELELVKSIENCVPDSVVHSAVLHDVDFGGSSCIVDVRIGYKFVVEYDGSLWHHSDESISRDVRKTVKMLDSGYTVIRIREAYGSRFDLRLLDLEHPRLLQIICDAPYISKERKSTWINSIVPQILEFYRSLS